MFEQFGNIARRQGSSLVNDEREPLVDMFEESNQITIVAELPGASEESIETTIEGDRLTLTAASRERKYRKELPLPYAPSKKPLKRSYLNGIFSMVLEKAVEPALKS